VKKGKSDQNILSEFHTKMPKAQIKVIDYFQK